jgi:hypothetical protein
MKIKKLVAGLALLGLAARTKTERGSVADLQTQLPTGFLDNYSQLSPGTRDQAMLVYIDRAAPWRTYTKVRIEPVTFWGDAQSTVRADVWQQLCDCAYGKLTEQRGKSLPSLTRLGRA